MLNRTIGEYLRLKRQDKKMTLAQIADEVGVSINYISKLEKGENSNPSDDIVVKLAETLDVDEDELFNGFEKIPLSTRNMLHSHPTLAKTISEINSNKELDEEDKKQFLEQTIYWYKKLLKDKKR